MAAPTTLPGLLQSLTQSLSLAQEATPSIAEIVHQHNGISLLDVKNELLLSYLQNLVFLILLKLRNTKNSEADIDDLDESVRSKLVELRLFLERGARPLEAKLRFSIERFLQSAENAQREKKEGKPRSIAGKSTNAFDLDATDSDVDDDEDSKDETDYKPNGLAHKRQPNQKSAAPVVGALIDDVTARPPVRGGVSSGVYQPPKRERQVMETERKMKSDRRPQKSRTMDEFVNSELSTAPLAEPSIGTTIVQGGRKMKTAEERKDEAERREYEESNFVRLPNENKKDRAKKARQAGSRMQFGGEEWHDLGEGVDRIERLTRVRQSGKGSSVRAMLDKSRKRGLDTTDGPRGSGHGGQIEAAYNKRLKMEQLGRRDRGKNR